MTSWARVLCVCVCVVRAMYKRMVARKIVFSHVGHVQLISSFVHSDALSISEKREEEKILNFPSNCDEFESDYLEIN